MGRPCTMPNPWRELVECIGGVGKLSLLLGTTPQMVRKWAKGQVRPSGAATVLIYNVFRAYGMGLPTLKPKEKV